MDKPTPATDETVNLCRQIAAEGFLDFPSVVVASLIARIDAERAEKDAERQARERVEAAAREVLDMFADDGAVCNRVLSRLRAALKGDSDGTK